MGFSDPIVAGTVLVRDAIASPNYAPLTSGWSINRDGTAEFQGLTIVGGTFLGGSIIMDGAGDGLFIYNGAPALGNLLLSISPSAGLDAWGNAYPAGFSAGSGARKVQVDPATPRIYVYRAADSWISVDPSSSVPTIYFNSGASGPGWINAPNDGLMEMSSVASGGTRARLLHQTDSAFWEVLNSPADTQHGGQVWIGTTGAGISCYNAAGTTEQSSIVVQSSGVLIDGYVASALCGNVLEAGNSANITTVEAVCSSITFPAHNGEWYGLSFNLKVVTSVANDSFIFGIRENNLAGTLVDAWRFTVPFAGSGMMVRHFIPWQASATNNKTMVGTLYRVGGTGNIYRASKSNYQVYLMS